MHCSVLVFFLKYNVSSKKVSHYLKTVIKYTPFAQIVHLSPDYWSSVLVFTRNAKQPPNFWASVYLFAYLWSPSLFLRRKVCLSSALLK